MLQVLFERTEAEETDPSPGAERSHEVGDVSDKKLRLFMLNVSPWLLRGIDGNKEITSIARLR